MWYKQNISLLGISRVLIFLIIAFRWYNHRYYISCSNMKIWKIYRLTLSLFQLRVSILHACFLPWLRIISRSSTSSLILTFTHFTWNEIICSMLRFTSLCRIIQERMQSTVFLTFRSSSITKLPVLPLL